MDAQVEKRSEKLGRDALYKKTTKISKLPYYLTVQFVRFEFVQHSQQNTKILRTCNFDMSLDVMDLCNDELKEQLKTVRKKLKDTEDKRLKLGKWAFQVTVCCCALRRRRRRLCQRSAAAQNTAAQSRRGGVLVSHRTALSHLACRPCPVGGPDLAGQKAGDCRGEDGQGAGRPQGAGGWRHALAGRHAHHGGRRGERCCGCGCCGCLSLTDSALPPQRVGG